MAGEIKNLSKLFKNSRSRAIILVTVAIFLVFGITGLLKWKKTAPTAPTEISLQKAPEEIQSIPGGFERPETAEYAKLQTQENIQKAKKAQETGGSAIPTIISSTPITGGWQGGGSFTNQLPPNYLMRGAGGP